MGCKCSKDVREGVKPGTGVRDVYRIGKILGSGAFGTVRECTRRDTREVYAMKIMEKSWADKGHWSNENMFKREVHLLSILDHPYIVRFHDFYEDRHFLYAVLEKCEGGELFESILRLRTFPEKTAASLCYQMLQALCYVHSKGVVHRDIKAENFLFKTSSPDSQLKLIDFGMSARITGDQTLTDVCGSPHYLSPELIRRRYGFKADIWALGVLIYLMIYGRYPFDGNNSTTIVKVILTKKVNWQPGDLEVSDKAISFMKMLLQRNPDRRPTALEATQHAWLAAARKKHEAMYPDNSSSCTTTYKLSTNPALTAGSTIPPPLPSPSQFYSSEDDRSMSNFHDTGNTVRQMSTGRSRLLVRRMTSV